MIKVKKRKILILPGDGIGPEVIREVKKIIQWFNKKKSLDFEMEEDLVGVDTDVEIFTPDGKEIIRISELRNQQGKQVDWIHGGAGRGAFPLENDPGEFTIIRRTLYEEEQICVKPES